MVRKKYLAAAAVAAFTAVGVVGVAMAASKKTAPPPPCPTPPPASFACKCTKLKSSGIVASLPAGATSNGSAVLSYILSLGCACAVGGDYLYLSGEDAAALRVKCGYWFVSGGTLGLTLTVSPAEVAPGGTLDYSGTGYTPNGRVEVNASGVGFFQVYPVIIADASGKISGSVTIQSTALAGAAELSVGDESTSQVKSAPFTVT